MGANKRRSTRGSETTHIFRGSTRNSSLDSYRREPHLGVVGRAQLRYACTVGSNKLYGVANKDRAPSR
jgi:hypothetical protein